MTDEGFAKGKSDNLPAVDVFMVASFMQNADNFSLGEVRGVKASKSGRKSYGDSAIGWVQVKRCNETCTVKAKITPEHQVKKKQYAVTCTVDEQSEKIVSVQCHDCAASSGGCKHAIAFLMWLHRRSEEPSPTDVTCYWKKSILSKVGSSLKYVTLKDFGPTQELSSDEDCSNFLKEVIDKGSENNSKSQILKYFTSDKITNHLGLHQLILRFTKRTSQEQPDVTNFVEFAQQEMTKDLCFQAAVMTATQSNSSLWFDLRYARITASKLYDAAHCKKCDGSFVNQVLGVTKIHATEAMARGKKLEVAVVKQLEKDLNIKFSHIGLQLDPKYPMFGASPDAICEEYVVEVKCPSSEKTVSNYLTKDNKITTKYKAQVNLQMFLLGKNKCLFCVADPNFEKNFQYSLIWVEYDAEYTEMIMEAADCFWRNNIFPYMFKSAFTV